MKFLTIGVLVLPLLSAGVARADHHDGGTASITFRNNCCDPPTRWADRQDTGDARLAITTEDGHLTLLLDDRNLALQLSNQTMHKVDRKIHEKDRDDDDANALGQALKSAILGAVRSMLDHSIECRIRDVRSVEYRGERLVITDEDGDRIFDDVEIDGRDALASFSPADARAFVAEFERVKHRR